MRKLIYLLVLWAPIISAQCDINISSWDATSGDIVIDVINSENCGCNEFTTIGNTCENSASPYVNNNTTISHIVLGLHVEGYDYNWGCTTANNHPGWTFKAWTLFGNQVLESGESWSANVYDSPIDNDCWAELLSNDSLCTEIVVWQINLSQTSQLSDGGWAINPSANQTQSYPDVDLSNNTAIYCAPPACDTIYVFETDTIEVLEYVYITDTIFVETIVYEYITDTLWLTEYVYITDTVYVDVIVDNYIYITDTITMTEYIIQTEYIDCETGLPCEDNPGIDVCDDNSIFIPNTFTPNNDGVNDIFYAVTDVTCWLTWELQIYNRWGTLIKEMKDPMDYWTGVSYSGHWLCPDGVYTWKLKATQPGASIQLNGLVSIFR